MTFTTALTRFSQIFSLNWNWRITALWRVWMFGSNAVLITNFGPQFITNPLTLTVNYNSNSTIPYTKSWLLLEPCTTESTPTLKNDLNVNLLLISQRKHWLSLVPLLDSFSIIKTDKPISTQLTFFWIHNLTLHRRSIGQNQANAFENLCKSSVQAVFNNWQISPFPKKIK